MSGLAITPCWWMPDSWAKALAADDGLVGRGAEADAFGEHLAGGVELLHDDVVRVGQLVAADHESGGDLFESGVAGALADAVDGALDLARAGLDAGEGVGDGHAEVVMAMGGEDDASRRCRGRARGPCGTLRRTPAGVE